MPKCPECNGTEFEIVSPITKLPLAIRRKEGGNSNAMSSVKIKMCKNCRFLKLYAR